MFRPSRVPNNIAPVRASRPRKLAALRREAQRGVRTTDSGDVVVERSLLELESRRSMRGGWDVGRTATRKLQGGATAAPLLMLVRQTEALRSSYTHVVPRVGAILLPSELDCRKVRP